MKLEYIKRNKPKNFNELKENLKNYFTYPHIKKLNIIKKNQNIKILNL
jgi:hypothetical protein